MKRLKNCFAPFRLLLEDKTKRRNWLSSWDCRMNRRCLSPVSIDTHLMLSNIVVLRFKDLYRENELIRQEFFLSSFKIFVAMFQNEHERLANVDKAHICFLKRDEDKLAFSISQTLSQASSDQNEIRQTAFLLCISIKKSFNELEISRSIKIN